MIVPTVGRVVWYRTHGGAPEQAAIVCKVHGDRMVNLAVFDQDGHTHALTSVKLVQEGDPVPDDSWGYCEWMPYQKGQAAKTEQLEKQAAR